MSWAQIRPKGSLRNRYLPCVELKVVHSELSWSSLTFQYPLRVSTIENYFAPFNFGRMSSSVGVWWCGCLMARLRSFGSRHSRSVPLLLATQTNELTQSVGSSTLVTIPCCTSVSSSFWSGSRSASGTRGGGWMTGGTARSKVIWNSPLKQLMLRGSESYGFLAKSTTFSNHKATYFKTLQHLELCTLLKLYFHWTLMFLGLETVLCCLSFCSLSQ